MSRRLLIIASLTVLSLASVVEAGWRHRVTCCPCESATVPATGAANVPAGANASANATPSTTAAGQGWTDLFDGKTLGKWKKTEFGGEGEVEVKDGMIVIPVGNDMSGITWSGDLPRMNYELYVETQRVDGSDFFCGLTFPIDKDPCSLILGGWGGSVVGISSLDGLDAANNDTTKVMNFKNGQWYKVRLRVTPGKIEAWLNDEQIVDVKTEGKRIGIRGEVEASKPLGISTWQTTGAVRAIRIKSLAK